MRVIELQQDNSIDKSLKAGVIFSLLLHLLFIYLIYNSPKTLPVIERSLDVSIIQDLPKITQQELTQQINQIVEPPQSEESPDESPATNLLSDKNFKAEKEQIKRGDAPDAGPVIAKSKPAEKAPPPKAAKQEPPKEQRQEKPAEQPPGKLSTLRLDDQTLLEKYSAQKPSKATPEDAIASYQAFSRPAGSGAAFIGLSGSSDHLPNLPDGDITLLNAKADKFAVFVRRVASLVFSHMRNTGWETLSRSDINRIGDFSTVRAILDPQGNLIKIILESSSGSVRFDTSLKSAVNSGAHDPNPPKAALAEDGNYHFVFKSKCWSATGNAPKTGAPYERRWLLLATGLL